MEEYFDTKFYNSLVNGQQILVNEMTLGKFVYEGMRQNKDAKRAVEARCNFLR